MTSAAGPYRVSDAYRVYARRQRARGLKPLTNRQWERRRLNRRALRTAEPTFADFLAPWRAARTATEVVRG